MMPIGPTIRLRPELTPLPIRLRRLPLDPRGYPVPWFVAWQNGQPEFRAMDAAKWRRAVQEKRCWVCGDILGKYLTFVVGPMCGLNRTSAEPPCHLDCADWSAVNCPFLSRPEMVRREDVLLNNETLVAQSAGTAIARNPGVTLLWTTTGYRVFDGGVGKPLIQMGAPETVRWYCEGRRATLAEVAASFDAGLPALVAIAEAQDREQLGAEAVPALGRAVDAFRAAHLSTVAI